MQMHGGAQMGVHSNINKIDMVLGKDWLLLK